MLCSCLPDNLCEACFARELLAKRGQAAAIGQCWAERVGRRREHQGQATWPDGPAAQAIALRLVRQLAADSRLRGELARAAIAGAAAWWDRRPARYRAR